MRPGGSGSSSSTNTASPGPATRQPRCCARFAALPGLRQVKHSLTVSRLACTGNDTSSTVTSPESVSCATGPAPQPSALPATYQLRQRDQVWGCHVGECCNGNFGCVHHNIAAQYPDADENAVAARIACHWQVLDRGPPIRSPPDREFRAAQLWLSPYVEAGRCRPASPSHQGHPSADQIVDALPQDPAHVLQRIVVVCIGTEAQQQPVGAPSCAAIRNRL